MGPHILHLITDGNVTLRGKIISDNPPTYFYLKQGASYTKRDSHSDGDVRVRLSRACPGKAGDSNAWTEVMEVLGSNPFITRPGIVVGPAGLPVGSMTSVDLAEGQETSCAFYRQSTLLGLNTCRRNKDTDCKELVMTINKPPKGCWDCSDWRNNICNFNSP